MESILPWPFKYRDIAPEGVDDAAIISLIQRSAGNNAAISAAIENMWHGKLCSDTTTIIILVIHS